MKVQIQSQFAVIENIVHREGAAGPGNEKAGYGGASKLAHCKGGTPSCLRFFIRFIRGELWHHDSQACPPKRPCLRHPQLYEVFKMLRGQLDEQLEAWKRILSTDVPGFNELIKTKNVPALYLPPAGE